MKHLAPDVRSNSIEITNALLRNGMEEGMAIRIAIASAKRSLPGDQTDDENAAAQRAVHR
jgi:uncharacterized protein YdaT